MSEQLLTIPAIDDGSLDEQADTHSLNVPNFLAFSLSSIESHIPDVIANRELERVKGFIKQAEEQSIRVDFCGSPLLAADQIFSKHFVSILQGSYVESGDSITEIEFGRPICKENVKVSQMSFRCGPFRIIHQTMDYMEMKTSSSYTISREEL